jgi:hypothetical protein
MSTATWPVELERRCRIVQQRWRDLVLARGLGQTLAVSCGGLLILLASDWWFDWPGVVRLAAIVAVLIATARVAFRSAQRWWRGVPTETLVRQLDQQDPDGQERLRTWWQLSSNDGVRQTTTAKVCYRGLTREIERWLSEAPFPSSWRGNKPVAIFAIGCVLLCAVVSPAMFWTPGYGLLWQRVIWPMQDLGWFRDVWLQVESPVPAVASGSELPVQCRVTPLWAYWSSGGSGSAAAQGAAVPPVFLKWRAAGSSAILERRCDLLDDGTIALVRIPRVTTEITWWLETTGGRSRKYVTQALPAPELMSAEVLVDPPAYTGLPSQKYPVSSQSISVLTNSRLTWQLRWSQPLAAARLMFVAPQSEASRDRSAASLTDGRSAVGVPAPATPVLETPQAGSANLERSRSNGSGSASSGVGTLVPENAKPGPWQQWQPARKEIGLVTSVNTAAEVWVEVTTNRGLTVVRPLSKLAVTADRPPTWTVQLPASQSVALSDSILLEAVAEDDLGLHSCELHVAGTQVKRTVAGPATRGRPRQIPWSISVPVADLASGPGDVVTLRLRAVDSATPGQIGWSDPLVFVVRRASDSLPGEQLAQATQDARRALQEVRQELEQARNKTRDVHQKIGAATIRERDPVQQDALTKAQQQVQQVEQQFREWTDRLPENPWWNAARESAEKTSEGSLAEGQKRLEQAASEEPRDQVATLSEALNELARSADELSRLDAQLGAMATRARQADELLALAERADALAQRLETPPAAVEANSAQMPGDEATGDTAPAEAAEDGNASAAEPPAGGSVPAESNADQPPADQPPADQPAANQPPAASDQSPAGQAAPSVASEATAKKPTTEQASQAANGEQGNQAEDPNGNQLKTPDAEPMAQDDAVAMQQNRAENEAQRSAQSDVERLSQELEDWLRRHPDFAEAIEHAADEQLQAIGKQAAALRTRQEQQLAQLTDDSDPDDAAVAEANPPADSALMADDGAAATGNPAESPDGSLPDAPMSPAPMSNDASPDAAMNEDASSGEPSKGKAANSETAKDAKEQSSTSKPANGDPPPTESPDGESLTGEPMAGSGSGDAQPGVRASERPNDGANDRAVDAGRPWNTPRPDSAEVERGRQAAAELREQAQSALKQAKDLLEQEGPASEATMAAIQAAEQAEQAVNSLQQGQPRQACAQCQAAGNSSERVGQSAATSAARREGQRQATGLQDLASQLEQMSPDQARGVQQFNQQAMQQQARKLRDQLNSAPPDKSVDKPSDKPAGGTEGEAAKPASGQPSPARAVDQALQRAESAMESAAEALGLDEPAAARQASQEATSALKDVERLTADSAPPENSRRLVPSQAGQSLAQARQSLSQAREQLDPLAEDRNNSAEVSNPTAEGSQPAEESRTAKEGQSNPGAESPMAHPEALSSSKPNARQAPQSLRSAANALRTVSTCPLGGACSGESSVAGNLSKKSGQSGSQPASESAGSSSSGTANSPRPTAQPDESPVEQLKAEVARRKFRVWGRMTGPLQSEVWQGAAPGQHPDYAAQIRSYFERLAKNNPEVVGKDAAPSPNPAASSSTKPAATDSQPSGSKATGSPSRPTTVVP